MDLFVNDKKFIPYISKEEIKSIIDRLASQINLNYKNSCNFEIIIILNGAFIFASDLIKKLHNINKIHFMKVSSYQGMKSTQSLKIDLDLKSNIEGKDILIIEDIIDTGYTMNTLCGILKSRNPKSLQICSFLIKPDVYVKNISKCHQINIPDNGNIKYIGKSIPNMFVIGYGLDYNDKFRELPLVYILKS